MWHTTASSAIPHLGGLLQGRQAGQLHWSSTNRDLSDNEVSISMFEHSREARLVIGKLGDTHSLFLHNYSRICAVLTYRSMVAKPIARLIDSVFYCQFCSEGLSESCMLHSATIATPISSSCSRMSCSKLLMKLP